MNTEARDTFEVLQITRHQLQLVMDSGSGDLKIRVLQGLSSVRKPRMNLPVDASDSCVKRENRNSRKDARLYVSEMPLGVSGFEGAPIELPQ
jgi:hypothetical protein